MHLGCCVSDNVNINEPSITEAKPLELLLNSAAFPLLDFATEHEPELERLKMQKKLLTQKRLSACNKFDCWDGQLIAAALKTLESGMQSYSSIL